MSVWRLVGATVAAATFASCALIAGVEEGVPGDPFPNNGGGGMVGIGGASQGGDAIGGATGPGGGGGMASGGGGSTGVGGMIEGMVNVPGATFMMGCNDGVDDRCGPDENPYHSITLSGYRIDMFEVTRSEYNDCIMAGDCNTPPCDFDPAGLQDHPVTCVTWDDALAYCTFAGKRMPTEAEWEYAARGDDGRRYPWGNKDFTEITAEGGSPCTFANANLCRTDTESVGTHPTGVSIFGAMDMAGNVAEWVHDRYDADYYSNSPATNPPGPDVGASRVIRGGGWDTGNSGFRVSSRSTNVTTFNDNETGFRCAL